MRSNTVISAVTALAISSVVTAQNDTKSTGEMATGIPGLSLTAQLRLADGAADRYKLLPTDEDFIFDFNEDETGVADRKSFPALVGANAAMALAEIPPCGMVAAHLHPRTAELFAVLTGRVYAESVPEAGVLDADGGPRVIRSELGPLQMTVFHQGAFHTQMNPDCEPALAVASFASEDPGAAVVAPQLFALSDDFVVNSFGGGIKAEDVEKIREAIPPGLAIRLDECRAKCGGSNDGSDDK